MVTVVLDETERDKVIEAFRQGRGDRGEPTAEEIAHVLAFCDDLALGAALLTLVLEGRLFLDFDGEEVHFIPNVAYGLTDSTLQA